MVASHTPSPLDVTDERVEGLMCDHSVRFETLHPRTKALKQGLLVYQVFGGSNSLHSFRLLSMGFFNISLWKNPEWLA